MGRREDNKRIKREGLIAAGRAAFTTQGYDRASIEQIARDAGVARGTFYLYFETKLALFQALTTPWVDDLVHLMHEVHGALADAEPAAVVGIYQQMGLAIALLGLRERDNVLLAFRESRRTGEAGDFLRSEEARIIEAAVAMTQLAADRDLIAVEDARVAVRIIFGAIERLTFDILTDATVGDPQLVATQTVQMFMRMLQPDQRVS